MNKYVFDTSFISALVNDHDINHNLAREAFAQISDAYQLLLPRIVLFELALLQISIDPLIDDLAFRFIQATNSNIVESGEPFFEGFRGFVHSTAFKLKTNDYTILYTSYAYNAILVTLDKKLNRHALQLKIETL